MLDRAQEHWFFEDKFGLFVHWGLYALLAGEYEGKKTHHIAEWIMHDLNIPKAEYEKLAQRFNPKDFDADALVFLAKEAGMRYVVLTAKHHDGFALFHTKADPYNVVDATPYKRDIAEEFKKACDKHGLRLCFYYSQAQDWHHKGGLAVRKIEDNPEFETYMREKCIPQLTELLTNYGDLGLIWFDTPVTMSREDCVRCRDLVKQLQPDCLVSGRVGHGLGDYMTTGDNFIPMLPFEGAFEVPATINGTWGYNKHDTNWKDAPRLIRDLVRIVSRGGNYLLNLGPDAQGHIPEKSQQVLREVGTFMKANGESIYGTTPVPVYPYDLPWLAYTARPHVLYIHVFEYRRWLYLINMGNHIKKATLLSDGRELKALELRTCEGVNSWNIELPEGLPASPDYVIKVEMQERDVVFEPLSV